MITDFDVLDRVLAEVERVSRMAVLHREAAVVEHLVHSDVDICVGSDPLDVAAAVMPSLRANGVVAILVFNYDRGSYSLFFSDLQGSGGAQVDLIHDPRGVSRYGVRTDALLAAAVPGIRWPRLDSLDEALYTLRKRQVKGDATGEARAREAIGALGAKDVRARADEIFGAQAASDMASVLAGRRAPARSTVTLWRSRALRPSRILRRCGHWAHVVGEPVPATATANALVRQMNRLISTRLASARPAPVLKHLWRPNLLVTTGRTTTWPLPDTVLASDSGGEPPDGLTRQLVESMHHRVCATFGFDGGERT